MTNFATVVRICQSEPSRKGAARGQDCSRGIDKSTATGFNPNRAGKAANGQERDRFPCLNRIHRIKNCRVNLVNPLIL
ncbi:hypothetical protein QUF80_15430 [Desulfococcaceae bacterium HSG8]|nr:hypothetical protein [Desulfococcaceae bacterium HSG8]